MAVGGSVVDCPRHAAHPAADGHPRPDPRSARHRVPGRIATQRHPGQPDPVGIHSWGGGQKPRPFESFLDQHAHLRATVRCQQLVFGRPLFEAVAPHLAPFGGNGQRRKAPARQFTSPAHQPLFVGKSAGGQSLRPSPPCRVRRQYRADYARRFFPRHHEDPRYCLAQRIFVPYPHSAKAVLFLPALCDIVNRDWNLF